MSGGGGGGGNNKSSDKKKAEPKVGSPMMTVQPFLPQMQNALAQQLAAGYGGTPQDFLSAFAQTYAPMQVPDYSKGWVPPGSSSSSSDSGPSSEYERVMKEIREAEKRGAFR